MSTPRIEVRRGPVGRRENRRQLWRFVVIAENGEPLATSEHYTTRRRAWEGARALIDAGKLLFEDPEGSIVDRER